MNSLTVNLHLMMVSFFRPTRERNRLLIEKSAFPSDRYAVASQLAFHGLNDAEHLIEIGPLTGEIQRIGIRSSSVKTTHGAEVIVPEESRTAVSGLATPPGNPNTG